MSGPDHDSLAERGDQAQDPSQDQAQHCGRAWPLHADGQLTLARLLACFNSGQSFLADSRPVCSSQLIFGAVQTFQEFGFELLFGLALLVGADEFAHGLADSAANVMKSQELP